MPPAADITLGKSGSFFAGRPQKVNGAVLSVHLLGPAGAAAWRGNTNC